MARKIEVPADIYKRLVARARRKGEVVDDLAADILEEALNRA